MKKGHTPSDYLEFLDSDEGKILYSNLRSSVEKVKPFKTKAILAFVGGVIAAILIRLILKTYFGLVLILPGIYFFYIYSNESTIVTEAQRKFNDGLNRFIFGDDYLSQKCNVDFIPLGFIKGLPNFSGLWKEGKQDLGKYGQSLKIRITRTFVTTKEGQEKKIDKTTYEQGNLVVLPSNSLVRDKQAFFYFDTKRVDILDSMGLGFNDKRNFTLTDTELAEWYEVSVGGLKDLLKDNDDERFLWTKIITPYFESVVKALVAKYGQLHLIVQDGYFFAFMPKKEAVYESVQYGKLNRKQYLSNWGTNESAVLTDGQSSPKKVLPYLYKVYLNKIMDAMATYFFMDHTQVDADKLEEAREILDYVLNDYNNVDINEMQELYNSKY